MAEVGAGDLTNRVRFESRALDANGDPLGPWTSAGDPVWAQLTWLRGTEAAMQQRLEGRQPVVITVRASTFTRQITPAWRAVNARDAAQRFAILTVSPARTQGFLDLLAVLGGATG
jgi:hypothetical protein